MRRLLLTLCTAVALTGAPDGLAWAQAGDAVIVGGYSPVDARSPEVVRAVKFALAAKNGQIKPRRVKLLSIKSAQQQVVAGVNYRACLLVRQKNQSFTVVATVYRDLSGAMSLTQWVPVNC